MKKSITAVLAAASLLFAVGAYAESNAALPGTRADAATVASTPAAIEETVVAEAAPVAAEAPVMTEEAFNRLQEVIEKAGELDQRAPYNKLINNTFAEKAKP